MNNYEWESAKSSIKSNSIKFILTNPETLKTTKVMTLLKAKKNSHIVIDESHTDSEWEETF